MKYRVQVREQVKGFIESLGPLSRRKSRLALRGLETERGDCLALKEKLPGYHRLRIGAYRVLFRYLPGTVIECAYAEERSLIYHLFEGDSLKRLRHGRQQAPVEERARAARPEGPSPQTP